VPAIRSYFTEPIWEQFSALLPDREVDHPLGCHRPRIPDRIVFEKLVEVLVFGCAYWRIADDGCTETLEAVAQALGGLPERASVHLDRGYDSNLTRERLEDRGLIGEISQKGESAPLEATNRRVVERTNSWHNAHKKLMWCTEREGRVIDFWVAFSDVVIIVRRLIREAWSRYRWEARPSRRP
jgi:hypothetical protein